TECSPTLPRWGSMRSGRLFERPMWAPHIDESDSSSLLPAPQARDGDHSSRSMSASTAAKRMGSGRRNLDDAAALLPTPTATRYGNNQSDSAGASVRPSLDSLAADLPVDWGKYASAIERWAGVLGRQAPHPTITGARGGKKLNPALAEWMMGWPAGWVTDVPGLSPNEQLRLCGNGVVPQQIQAAVRHLLPLLSADGRAA